MAEFDGTDKSLWERAEGAPVEESGWLDFCLCMPDGSVDKVMLRFLRLWRLGG